MHRRFRRIYSEATMGALGVTEGNGLVLTKHTNISYREAHINNQMVKYSSNSVRTPVSPTQDDIKSYLEVVLSGDTDLSTMDDEL